VRLGGGAREVCEKLGITDMLITISHCRTHATAFAIAVGQASSEADDDADVD
jgi:holo-[acyl-carrier protein] synthase